MSPGLSPGLHPTPAFPLQPDPGCTRTRAARLRWLRAPTSLRRASGPLSTCPASCASRVTGASILSAAQRDRITGEIEFLAAGSAGALGAVDTIYTSSGRIPPVYLLDAVAEAGIVALWLGLSRGYRQA